VATVFPHWSDSMKATTISLLDVQARWAYSEIIDSNFAKLYDGREGVEALRKKRQTNVSMEKLPLVERYNLAFLCVSVRPNMMWFVTGIERFQEVDLDRTAVATLLVPPMVTPDLQGKLVPLTTYMDIPTASSDDARNVVCPPEGYQASKDPVTVGYFYEHRALIDGYHRVAAFWKYGPADGIIRAYVPDAPSIGKLPTVS
jgi:hypothetical protein